MFAYAKTKAQISCAVTDQDSSFLLWVYRSVCVRPGRKIEDLFSLVAA